MHAASDALSAPSLPSAASAASIEASGNEHAPNIAGPHHPASSPTLPAQTPAAVDLPAWPLPLATDSFHHGAYIALLSLAEKLGAPVNHQLLALALVPTLALYPGSVLRSDNGVSPAPTSAASSTTVPTSAMPSRPPTASHTADAPTAAMARVPSPAVSVPSSASYVPLPAETVSLRASSVPSPASSAPQATTNSTPVSGQHVQPELSNPATTTSATNSTAAPSKSVATSIPQENNTPITLSEDEPTNAAGAGMDDTSAPPQERKRNRGGKRVWLRIEKAKIRDALRAAEARRVE
ncbi:hypothetical protein K525DRAFT_271614 [Schizophyllum commune Loenen D]|nr:hypothetical protein K525DRAFT_271614 [Schizophyllum commune Loenen D]